MLEIRPATMCDWADWLAMRSALWPLDYRSSGKHEAQMRDILADANKVALLAFVDGEAAGFAECSLRPYVDGCDTSPVSFLEGWFVHEDFRRQGIGRALVEAAKSWARSKGCSEMGSDSDIKNNIGCQAHAALGFQEVERVVNWMMKLD